MKRIIFFLFLMLFMAYMAYPVFSFNSQLQLETGNTFEVAFDLKEKQVLRGWLNDYDMPEVFMNTFGGYPLYLFMDDVGIGKYKFSAELHADDCFAGLNEPCKYESPEFSLESGIGVGDVFLYSNFNVPYHTFLSFLGNAVTAPYISVMSSSLGLSNLNLSEIGFISNNPNFAWEGDYIHVSVSKVLEGTWKITGVILGEEWLPFYGIANLTTEKIFGSQYANINGIGVNANTGAILNLNINFNNNAKIWMHNSTRYVAIWKNVYDGSQNGFFMQLAH